MKARNAPCLSRRSRFARGRRESGSMKYRCCFPGDLLNQIVSAGFAARSLGIPFYGLYGACSTMSESLSIGGMLADGGFADRLICATCSHFCTAERQYRAPRNLATSAPDRAGRSQAREPVMVAERRQRRSGQSCFDPYDLRARDRFGNYGCEQHGRGDGALRL